MTPLNLDLSRKIYELVGEYETDKYWVDYDDTGPHLSETGLIPKYPYQTCFPAPTFSELIRILPRIGEKLDWRSHLEMHSQKLLEKFMLATTDQKGMEAVEAYLEKLI